MLSVGPPKRIEISSDSLHPLYAKASEHTDTMCIWQSIRTYKNQVRPSIAIRGNSEYGAKVFM